MYYYADTSFVFVFFSFFFFNIISTPNNPETVKNLNGFEGLKAAAKFYS